MNQNQNIIKKGAKVIFTNNFGAFEGVVKTILPNPNGESQVIVMIENKQSVTYPLSKVQVLN